MSLTEADARAGLALAEEKVGRRRSHMSLELLGRAHQWLDEPEPARAAFLAAVADLHERLYETDRRTFDTDSRRGGLLLLAGEREEAREWLARAAQEPAPSPGSLDQHGARIAQRLAALGDAAGAERAARACGPEFVRAHAAVAVVSGDARTARELLLPVVRETPPWLSNGSEPLASWDWWARALTDEATGAGEPAPSFAAMLAAGG